MDDKLVKCIHEINEMRREVAKMEKYSHDDKENRVTLSMYWLAAYYAYYEAVNLIKEAFNITEEVHTI